jgi:hypothetical protein
VDALMLVYTMWALEVLGLGCALLLGKPEGLCVR